jgi:hypothetical protein
LTSSGVVEDVKRVSSRDFNLPDSLILSRPRAPAAEGMPERARAIEDKNASGHQVIGQVNTSLTVARKNRIRPAESLIGGIRPKNRCANENQT